LSITGPETETISQWCTQLQAKFGVHGFSASLYAFDREMIGSGNFLQIGIFSRQIVRHQLLMPSPEPFITEVCKQPMKESRFAYNPVISELNIDEKIASAKLAETYPDGMRFTNYFHLIDDGSGWKIISKVFTGKSN
jgi:hypothetical protein